MLLTDIDGKRWKLWNRIHADRIRDAQMYIGYQITPHCSQLNLSEEDGDCPAIGLTLPNHLADDWMAGKIKIKVR